MTLRFRHYTPTKPTRGRRSRCVDCGADIDRLAHPEMGFVLQLEPTSPPVGDNLAGEVRAGRVWEWRGEWIGWCNKFTPQRTWREIRLAHRCEPSARTRRSA